jgi:hypothetical protein
MPVEVKRNMTLVKADGGKILVGTDDKVERREVIIEKSGNIIVLEGTEKVEALETQVKIICAGPRCAARHLRDTPVTIEFDEEKVKTNPTALPDDFARILKLTVNAFVPQEDAFCSPRCIKDFLDYTYVPPKSPREIAEQMKNNQAIEERKEAKRDSGDAIAEAIATPAAFQTPVSQADGDAGQGDLQ